jgi:hypothetical protein
MAKKKQKKEIEMGALEQQELFDDLQVNEEIEIKTEDLINIHLTHKALSMIKNDNGSYSVVSIGFNPKENIVSPVIECIETNTDMFIVQERLSVLLFDIHNTAIED